ncbi:MAG: histone deacetylase [Limnobacter sp.]|nr:histone deacetylase [Limnobacter sp.]
MHAFYTDEFVLPLPEGHRFPMQKYRMLRDKVSQNLNGINLLKPNPATRDQLLLAHSPVYIDQVFRGKLSPAQQKEIGFPWSVEMVERSIRSVGATVDGVFSLIEVESKHQSHHKPHHKAAVNLAGGTHHAMQHTGSGFCVFNDTVVAARVLQQLKPQAKVLVIDLDVHQGDGTAAITQGDHSIFTLSLHGHHNYPFVKQNSDLDVALPDGTGDEDYLLQLENALSRTEQCFPADFVFYLAGMDVHQNDRLGRLCLTDSGIEERDNMVFSWLSKMHLPVVMSMAGGYFKDLDHLTDLQCASIGRLLRFSVS